MTPPLLFVTQLKWRCIAYPPPPRIAHAISFRLASMPAVRYDLNGGLPTCPWLFVYQDYCVVWICKKLFQTWYGTCIYSSWINFVCVWVWVWLSSLVDHDIAIADKYRTRREQKLIKHIETRIKSKQETEQKQIESIQHRFRRQAVCKNSFQWWIS